MKDYFDKLMKIVNQVRLLGAELSDARIVEKVLLMHFKLLSKVEIRLKEVIETALQTKFKENTVLESNGKKSSGDKRDKNRKFVTNQEVQGEKPSHMTPNASLFSPIDQSQFARIEIGNGDYLEAIGKGTIVVSNPTRTRLALFLSFQIGTLEKSYESKEQNILNMNNHVLEDQVLATEGASIATSPSPPIITISNGANATLFKKSVSSGAFSSNSKKQEMVAQSLAEAEYVSATTTSNQVNWLRKYF
ncbi:Uncharacterized protein TCM_031270 [Theobroma cacao]|uniref:Uncharacterized protein n=1 Tax=Theobroma cacao TaxID=3641 RepID=A0A061F6S9_THECC|nr:Uncharacterized protein TCM_031270 [Theobroma cacao]